MYKYVQKGPDRAMVNVANRTREHAEPEPSAPRDEVAEYLDARVLGSSMCAWKLFGFKMHGRFPAVQRLDVHLAGEQYIQYEEGLERAALRQAENEKAPSSTLLAWLEYLKRNSELAEAEQLDHAAVSPAASIADTACFDLKYQEFPKFYVYDKKIGSWKRRGSAPKRNDKSVGLVFPVPVNKDVGYFRILLVHLRGRDLRLPSGLSALEFTHDAFKFAPDKNGARLSVAVHASYSMRLCVSRGGHVGLSIPCSRLYVVLHCPTFRTV